MLQAELKGKLPSAIEVKEDILTSNVFSFFDYADRTTYLKAFLNSIGFFLSAEEADQAELIFWPTLDDGTEPDVVIIAGNLYILFEAKYFSDFSPSIGSRDEQLMREIKTGLARAKSLNKTFKIVAITADYTEPKEKFRVERQVHEVIWTHWQAVTTFLENMLSKEIPQKRFAEDLYAVLKMKNLRPFRGYDYLCPLFQNTKTGDLFFDFRSSEFRGKFIGFDEALVNIPFVTETDSIFFIKR